VKISSDSGGVLGEGKVTDSFDEQMDVPVIDLITHMGDVAFSMLTIQLRIKETQLLGPPTVARVFLGLVIVKGLSYLRWLGRVVSWFCRPPALIDQGSQNINLSWGESCLTVNVRRVWS
jgi:hypothetical protein